MVTENISEMIETQREFFHSSRTKDIGFRMEMLKKLRNVIDEYERRITQALYDDLGKSPFEAYMTEIGIVKNELSHHLRHVKSWAKPKRVKTPLFHSMKPWKRPFPSSTLCQGLSPCTSFRRIRGNREWF